MTTRYDCDHRTLHWNSRKNSGSFYPDGPLQLHGDRAALQSNPEHWTTRDTYAARIIVGFERKGKRPATLNQLVRIVRRVRKEQVGDQGATFLSQRGIYQRTKKQVIDEPGAQVLIINTPGMKTSPKKFAAQMLALAEVIATELGQDEVILEMQKNGITQQTSGVGP